MTEEVVRTVQKESLRERFKFFLTLEHQSLCIVGRIVRFVGQRPPNPTLKRGFRHC